MLRRAWHSIDQSWTCGGPNPHKVDQFSANRARLNLILRRTRVVRPRIGRAAPNRPPSSAWSSQGRRRMGCRRTNLRVQGCRRAVVGAGLSAQWRRRRGRRRGSAQRAAQGAAWQSLAQREPQSAYVVYGLHLVGRHWGTPMTRIMFLRSVRAPLGPSRPDPLAARDVVFGSPGPAGGRAPFPVAGRTLSLFFLSRSGVLSSSIG